MLKYMFETQLFALVTTLYFSLKSVQLSLFFIHWEIKKTAKKSDSMRLQLILPRNWR